MEDVESSAPVGDSESDDAPGFGTDKTPLGDTEEHAGDVSEEGHLKSDPEDPDDAEEPDDAESRPRRAAVDPDAAAHSATPGEGEGRERLDFDAEQPPPASERLADRDV